MDNKIAFVILHYKIVEETIKCVESILRNYKDDRKSKKIIIVVDNGSCDGTGENLSEKYNKNSNVIVIINKKNLGFSKGNNVGFKKAKEMGANYIVMANSDIVFTQKEFCDLIIDRYKEYDYAVLGPKIIMTKNIKGTHNPVIRSVKQQRIYICILYARLIFARIHLESVFKWIIDRKYKKRKKTVDTENLKFGVSLYGCCMVFSKNYIQKFDGLDDRTYMFCEEELLYLRLKSNNMVEVYDPSLEVFHNHSSSIDAIYKTRHAKELFMAKNLIKSNKILLKELIKMEKKK